MQRRQRNNGNQSRTQQWTESRSGLKLIRTMCTLSHKPLCPLCHKTLEMQKNRTYALVGEKRKYFPESAPSPVLFLSATIASVTPFLAKFVSLTLRKLSGLVLGEQGHTAASGEAALLPPKQAK
mmetsp:Transcript_89363/g.133982  ORF Transcript_89363/g.133982 Transcript_89363/m.133982 type:complete len:124 (-) Transcript_89363:145-516(-)